MGKKLLLACLCLWHVMAKAQTYTPVTVTGFNHDVIAEGTGNSTLATTTKEMDAITPSNFVICSKQFANSNGFTPSGSYGIPDNGTISTATRTYQLAPYTGNNALYLLTGENGTLTLGTPGSYSNISLLVLATENAASVSVIFQFTDGTTYNAGTQSFTDWFNNTTNIALQGFGRVKRKTGPFAAADYEGAGVNPRIYYKDFSLPCNKTLASIYFANTTSSVVTASNRAFVFAVSGVAAPTYVAPTITNATVCTSGSSTTLTIQNPQSGFTYRWYTALTGGSLVWQGTTFSPTVNNTITYYIETSNLTSGCTYTPRIPVTVTVATPPTAPATTGTNVCSGSTGTLSVQNPDANLTYSWYAASTGGTALATGSSFTTPAVTGTTTYYVEAKTAAGCISGRTGATVTVYNVLATPTVVASSISSNSVTFSWNAVVGASSYQVSVNGGANQTPSSGATGTTHTITGLNPMQTVTITVYAIATLDCQKSSGTATAQTVTEEIFIPNVFSPNGDNKNDVLYVYGNIIQSLRMQIFNQWGEKVFETSDKSTGWNGSYKGKQQPVGVYVYVVRIVTTGGTTVDRKGSITLIR